MSSMSRPNVLLLYTDQQRWDSLGCYGNPFAISPNLDQLAQQGARLGHFYINNPVCAPSRMSFLTGRYPSSLGIGCNGIAFPEKDAMPINRLLSRYNYHTAQIGKLHFDPHTTCDHRDPGHTYGFDTFILSDEPGCYEDAYIQWVETHFPEELDAIRAGLPHYAQQLQEIRGISRSGDRQQDVHEPYVYPGSEQTTHTAFVATETCEFLKSSSDNPFFCIAGFYAPHTPINPPKRFLDMFSPSDMPLPKLGSQEQKASFLSDISDKKWAEIVTSYYALCTHVDDQIGRILKTLDEVGKTENTIVVFTSDHGEYLGDHGRIQKWMPGHDCVARVPFIIRYPGVIPQGTVVDQIVEGVDFVPTILDYCAVQIPTFVQGKSVKPVLQGQTTAHKDAALIEYFEPCKSGTHSSSIKTKEYLYCISEAGDEVLYDRKNNPEENMNVADSDEYQEVLSKMRKRLINRLQVASYSRHERYAMY